MINRSSRKDKGKRLQKWTAMKISEVTGLEWGKDCPIESREGSSNGPDVRLDSRARELFPFTVECKNQESWAVPSFISQAKANTYPGTNWLLIVSKNRFKPIAILDAEVFFKILEGGEGVEMPKDKELPVPPRTRVRTRFGS